MTRAAVIGAGPSGLALALRLQAAGVNTTVIEARPHPGGRLATHAAPLADLAGWRELWTLAGADFAVDVTPLPVAPLRRLNWPDSTQLDWTEDPAALSRVIARLAPGDLAGFESFLALSRDLAAHRRRPPPANPLHRVPSRLATLAHTLPDWLRAHAWQSLDARAAAHVGSEKLRQVLSHPALLAGLNPLATPATHAATLAEELDRGLWWPRGGTMRLATALAARFTALGGELHLADPATAITTLGNRATGVTCASDTHIHADCVISTADPLHTWHTLLAAAEAAAPVARRLRQRRWTPGLFTVHFTLAGSWPGIPHDTVLFAQRWQDLLGDVFDRGVLPTDMVIRLLHPTVTDPTPAPPGHSLFTAQIPVPNLAMLPIDWQATGPLMQRRVLDEIGRRLIPDIHDRVLAATHRTPRDDALDYNAWSGSAAGPAPCRLAELWPPRNGPVTNLWHTCAAAGGAGGAIAQARATATRILATSP